MTHNDALYLDSEYIMGTYGRYPVAVSHGKNATLYDLDGREYIDFTSGIGVNALGFCNEGYIAAVTEQLNKFQHISNYYTSPVTAELARRIVTLSGFAGGKVFFGNSGAEANEGAIKVARKYSFDKYGTGRSAIISLQQSFHGRTITTLAATGQDSFHNYFHPFTEGFKYVPLNDITALEAALTGDVCAVIAEPIQGEGGVNLMEEEYARHLRAICDQQDILLIFDEVQAGIGRTGSMFAYQQTGVVPDIVTLAKGLGGGLPIGAFLCDKKCAGVLTAGMHGSTFGGNPVSAAGACYVLDFISQNGFLNEVTAKGGYIMNTLRAQNFSCVKEIRGRGLMIGIAVEGAPKEFAHKAFDRGLLVLTAGTDVIRLLPPLTVSEKELDRGLEILMKVLGETE